MSSTTADVAELKDTVAPPVHVTTETKALVAELGKIAEQQKETQTAVQMVTEQLKKVQESYAKTRPLIDPERKAGRRTWDDVIYDGDPVNDFEERARKLTNRMMLRQILRGHVVCRKERGPDGDPVVKYDTPPRAAFEVLPEWREFSGLRGHIVHLAASDMWDTADTSEWRPTGFTSDVLDYVRVRGGLLANIRTIFIPRGVGAYAIPTVTSDTVARLTAETTTASASFLDTATYFQGSTGQALLSPKKHMITMGVSTEGEEDFVVNTMEIINEEVTNALIGAVEQAMINGQATDSTVLDDAPSTSGLYAANGYADAANNSFRLMGVTNTYSNSVGGDMTSIQLGNARELMSRTAVNPQDLGVVYSPKAYLGALKEGAGTANAGPLTVDKFGPNAVILTGMLGSILGIPIWVSDQMPETLAATGIDAGTAATTGAILFNRRRWFLGIKRNMQRTLLPQPGLDSIHIVATARNHFVGASTTERNMHYFFNVT